MWGKKKILTFYFKSKIIANNKSSKLKILYIYNKII